MYAVTLDKCTCGKNIYKILTKIRRGFNIIRKNNKKIQNGKTN